MSSPSDDRYQSRLFNFIRKQSRFFRDLCGLRTRQLKVATNWSLEAMLYPIYRLWQSTVESRGRQLASEDSEDPSDLSKLEKNSSTQTSISVDMAVLRVKKVVEKLQLEKIKQGGSKFVDSEIINNVAAIPVRGIASCISVSTSCVSGVGQLVLVTSDNEILDILTPQQQEKLQDVIITEIANYWKARRLSEVEKPASFLLTISRLLKKLTSGKSKTKALTAALTDIGQIDIKQGANEDGAPFSSNKTLFAVDAAIAQVESNTLVPVSQATLAFQKHSSQLVLSMKTKFPMFFKHKEKVPNKTQNSVSTDATGETQFSPFQNLIQGALNYFFGKRDRDKINQLETVNSYTSSLPGNVRDEEADENSRNPKINNDNINYEQETVRGCANQSQSLLELQDVFSEPETVEDPNSAASFLIPETEKPPAKNLLTKIVNIFQKEEYSDPKRQYWVAKRKPLDTEEDFTQTELKADTTSTKDRYSAFTTADNLKVGEAQTQTSSRKSLDRSFDEPSKIVTNPEPDTSYGAIVHQPSKSSSHWEIEDKPGYLDTEGKVVGYHKHPVERVLQWLDNALLTLEDIFARIVSLVCMLMRSLRKL